MNRTQIREIFLRNGFSIKPGCDDLKSYVYEAAEELLNLAEVERLSAAQAEQYPPCDFCGVIPDHHPWHGSGMLKGVDSPHIHACNGCRHLLLSRIAQHAPDMAQMAEALVWYSEQVSGCRKVTSEGEQSRAALDRDGGARARAALAAHRKHGGLR